MKKKNAPTTVDSTPLLHATCQQQICWHDKKFHSQSKWSRVIGHMTWVGDNPNTCGFLRWNPCMPLLHRSNPLVQWRCRLGLRLESSSLLLQLWQESSSPFVGPQWRSMTFDFLLVHAFKITIKKCTTDTCLHNLCRSLYGLSVACSQGEKIGHASDAGLYWHMPTSPTDIVGTVCRCENKPHCRILFWGLHWDFG